LPNSEDDAAGAGAWLGLAAGLLTMGRVEDGTGNMLVMGCSRYVGNHRPDMVNESLPP
jgi:hypothetical protein